MQNALDFGQGEDIAFMRARLLEKYPQPTYDTSPNPTDQLVGSIISGQTYDRVSLNAFFRLKATFQNWRDLLEANEGFIRALIFDVTHPERKAGHLLSAMRRLGNMHSDFDLSFLKGWSVREAHAWLEQFDGVGSKVAASVLNCGLDMQTFVVDTHGLRILMLYGFVGKRNTWHVCERVVAAAEDWTGAELWNFMMALKQLGREICRPAHGRCRQCPLAERCLSSTIARR